MILNNLDMHCLEHPPKWPVCRLEAGIRQEVDWVFPIRQETKIETTLASAGRIQGYMTFLRRRNRRAQGIAIIVYAKCGVGLS